MASCVQDLRCELWPIFREQSQLNSGTDSNESIACKQSAARSDTRSQNKWDSQSRREPYGGGDAANRSQPLYEDTAGCCSRGHRVLTRQSVANHADYEPARREVAQALVHEQVRLRPAPFPSIVSGWTTPAGCLANCKQRLLLVRVRVRVSMSTLYVPPQPCAEPCHACHRRAPGHPYQHRRLPAHVAAGDTAPARGTCSTSARWEPQADFGAAHITAERHARWQIPSAQRPDRPRPNSCRAPTRLAVLRRRLEAADVGLVSGRAGGSTVTATATAPALETGRVLESLRLTAEEPDDSFLLRWLRSRRDDVEQAEAAVRTHADWRAQSVPIGGISEACACVYGGGSSEFSTIRGCIDVRMCCSTRLAVSCTDEEGIFRPCVAFGWPPVSISVRCAGHNCEGAHDDEGLSARHRRAGSYWDPQGVCLKDENMRRSLLECAEGWSTPCARYELLQHMTFRACFPHTASADLRHDSSTCSLTAGAPGAHRPGGEARHEPAQPV